ncbi:MAG TPA: YncE family protein [Thermohalobaculum sp.]|nr:YncE family protein [Thermohalobaculum sp.]
MRNARMCGALACLGVLAGTAASAEILAMMNYESKPAEDLKSLKLSGDEERREGIAIVDVDPESETFGKWLLDIPLDPSQTAHHIFYDRSMTKAYLTSLGSPPLQVMDMTRFPPMLKTIDVPECVMAEDVILDEANEHWYLTCMGSANVWKGLVADDSIVAEIELPGTYPHGLGIDSELGRIVVTSTVSPDMSVSDDVVSVVDAATLEPLGALRLSEKEEAAGEAPVEVLPVPGGGPEKFIVTNMFGNSVWALSWDEAAGELTPAKAIDFAPMDVGGVPLEMYFNPAGDRLYVTTANPGHLHVFDVSAGVMAAEPIASIPTAGGAHHVGFTKDGKYAFVQNSFINLPDMRDGSVTVIDLATNEEIASVDTLKDAGFNPNSIVLLPEWNDFAGH